ncbi:hypothetical protein V4Y02_24220, partial [Escherichia coli]
VSDFQMCSAYCYRERKRGTLDNNKQYLNSVLAVQKKHNHRDEAENVRSSIIITIQVFKGNS